MIAAQLLQRDSNMRWLNYRGMILLTVPFIFLGVFIGLFECCLGTDGATAEYVVRPFIWAYRRKVGR